LSKVRKAFAAFIASVVTLPFGAWILGEEVFSWSVVLTALGVALANAVGVYMSPANTA
jgi:threonine/homoserine efflux transporter RhtA